MSLLRKYIPINGGHDGALTQDGKPKDSKQKDPRSGPARELIGNVMWGLWDLVWEHKWATVALIAGFFVAASATELLVWGHVPNTPVEVVKIKGPTGLTFATTLRNSMDAARKRGWVANDLLSFIVPYRKAEELGGWDAWQGVLGALRYHLSRDGFGDEIDPHLRMAAGSMGDSLATRWLFPSAESTLSDAIIELDAYITALPKEKNFKPRTDNVYELFAIVTSQLADVSSELRRYAKSGAPFGAYVPYYDAKGHVREILGILESCLIDCSIVFDAKPGTEGQLKKAIAALKEAMAYKSTYPYFVFAGGMGTNDLANLNNPISDAVQHLIPMTNSLRN